MVMHNKMKLNIDGLRNFKTTFFAILKVTIFK
jgi:hypothetical protein